MTLLRDRLIKSEGWKNHVYTDTVGKLTIGVGFNLSDVGLFDEEINFILDNRIKKVQAFLNTTSFYAGMDEVRKGVIEDMCFNIGPEPFNGNGFKDWPLFVNQLNTKDYTAAASNMRGTLWAKQVGQRAIKLALIMETGIDES